MEGTAIMDCESLIDKHICVEAKVTVIPEAEIGRIESHCVGLPEIEECCCDDRPCTFMVSQMICIRFPLAFSVTAKARPAIVCDTPEEGLYPAEQPDCGDMD
jgi:hypothetical protein